MFIILPVGMNYQTTRAPVVTFTLMGSCILIYLVGLPFMLAQESERAAWMIEHFWLVPAYASWYSYLTAVFFHVGFFHLLGNMIYLFLFGSCVEDMIGRGRFLALYLLSGVGANLAYIALIPDHFESEIPMCGASGAISACLGAYLLLRSKVDIEFKYFGLLFLRFFSGEFSLAAWVVIMFWFLKDLFFAGLSFYLDKGGGGVAFGAHVGGFLMGAGLLGISKLIPARNSRAKPAPVPVRRTKPAAPAALPEAAEAPTAPSTIYVYQGEAQYGPYNLFHIREMLAQGSVTSDAQYWSEGMPEWRSVAELTRVTAGA